MLTTCTACRKRFLADDEEQACETVRHCPACRDAPCGNCGHFRGLHYADEACVAHSCPCLEFVSQPSDVTE